jgi:hypothetical protein
MKRKLKSTVSSFIKNILEIKVYISKNLVQVLQIMRSTLPQKNNFRLKAYIRLMMISKIETCSYLW